MAACKKILYLLLTLYMAGMRSNAQQYNFINYGVEQGLAQSQPLSITSDSKGFLWIATLAGISRFDGINFFNYGTSDGLASMFVYSVCPAKENSIWISTQNGVHVYDGRKFENCSIPEKDKKQTVINIIEAGEGTVFLHTAEGKIFSCGSAKKKNAASAGFENLITTCMARDMKGNMHAAVYTKGVFLFEKGRWKHIPVFYGEDTAIVVKKFFFDSRNKMWLLTNKGVFTSEYGSTKKVEAAGKINPSFTCIEQDSRGRIWVGTTKGAWILSETEALHIGAAAGFSDNSVVSIHKDREGNLWFATDGDGVFKLGSTSFSSLNKASGLNGNVLMACAEDDKKNIWLGTSEGGLSRFDGKKVTAFVIPSKKAESQKINSMLYDSQKRLWIGTIFGGIWKYSNGKFSEVLTEKGKPQNDPVSFYEDSSHTIWLCTASGLFYIEGGVLKKINSITQPCFSICQTDANTLLAGTTSGLFKLTDRTKASAVNLPLLASSTVNCFAKWKNFLLMGTENKGIIFWDPATGASFKCSSEEGLSSSFIFSLYNDGNKFLYAGTAHGLHKIKVDEVTQTFSIKNFIPSNSRFGPECNLNAIHKTADGKLWVGTTKGAMIYDSNDSMQANTAPLIYLSSVQLFSKPVSTPGMEDSIEGWNIIPKNLLLSHNQNHISFEFTGLYFTNPPGIRYRYRLEGADTGWQQATNVPKVIYPNLLPGKYIFRAVAINDEGIVSSNSIHFVFEIRPPFYQQAWFRLAAALMLISAGITIQYIRTRIKNKRIEALKKIRLEEQQRIQERTSEDLHDDLGNKITRIAVLADVLQKKIGGADDEKEKLVLQIRENAQALYLGTKDIIWSLTPGNDNLFDLMERCRLFGIHLFEDTGIEFSAEGIDEKMHHIKIPVEISRNLVMTLKEGLSNALKHSGASAVEMKVLFEGSMLMVEIKDNGKGMENRRHSGGNGIANMQKRMERIGGRFEMATDSGLSLKCFIKIPPQG